MVRATFSIFHSLALDITRLINLHDRCFVYDLGQSLESSGYQHFRHQDRYRLVHDHRGYNSLANCGNASSQPTEQTYDATDEPRISRRSFASG